MNKRKYFNKNCHFLLFGGSRREFLQNKIGNFKKHLNLQLIH